MIAALLALALAVDPAQPPPASIDGLPIGGIGKQALPAKGCAAYLFSTGTTRALIAMASAEPAQIRLAIEGRTIDVARASQSGSGGYGFSGTTEYRSEAATVALDMTIVTRADLTNGATVREATLRIDRAGQDSIVVPVAGLIGCA